MLSSSRRRRAENAVADVVMMAILEVRTMAYLREPHLDAFFPGADHDEQIRLVADVCDTLVLALRNDRRYSALKALQIHLGQPQ